MIILGILGLIAAVVISLVVRQSSVKKAYPMEYLDIIKANASEYELDPYLVLAVIKTESGFRPEVESRVGAQGLMQVMPATAEWIAGKLKEDIETLDLTDPQTNIRYGCWYLNFLQERFGDDINAVLAAYNAGHGKVREWLDDSSISPEGMLTEIPYPEAKQYVERVLHAREKYMELYEI